MFYKKKGGLFDRSSDCRICRRAYQREYAEIHKDERKAYDRDRYNNNKGYFSEKYARWYEENPGYMKEYRKRKKEDS